MGSSDHDARPEFDATRAAGAVSGALSGAARGGWNEALGLEVVAISAGSVVAHWDIDARHLQPQGIVHGGVYASVVETCCSLGAMAAAPPGKVVVGIENHTSFVRSAREGRLSARAAVLHAGQRAQLWECTISDAAGRLIASGRLRLMCVDAGHDR